MKGTKKYIHCQSVVESKSYTAIYVVLDLETHFVGIRTATLY